MGMNRTGDSIVYVIGCVLTLGGLWVVRCMISTAIRLAEENR